MYKIDIAEKLEKRLNKIPKKDKEKIIEKIDSLSSDPRPKDSKKLRGYQKVPLYRVRFGVYRIVYAINDEILMVLVVDIDHRKEIYR